MADSNLLSLLDTNDLLNFNNTVQQSDPYGITGNALSAWNPNTSTWSPTETGVASFGKAFLSGILGNYARQRAGEQLQSVVGALPSLRSDPYNTAVPEGVDSSAFNVLKGSAILKKDQFDSIVGDKKKETMSDLLKSVLGEGIKNRTISATDALKIAASDDPGAALDLLNANRVEKPAITDPLRISNNTPSLTVEGRRSTAQRRADLSNFYQSPEGGNMSQAQAGITARKDVEDEVKANTKTFDEAREARAKGQEILDLAATAEAGMNQAGQTGNKLASFYEKAVSTLAPWGTPEADAQSVGDTALSSIAPKMVQMMRSPGAVSDFENKKILEASPSPTNTPEQNAFLINRMKELGKLNVEYADFLEAFRDQNGGSTSGADKKWNEYKQSFPLFTEDGSINAARPSWQDYFSGNSAGGQKQVVQSGPPSPGNYPSAQAYLSAYRAWEASQ